MGVPFQGLGERPGAQPLQPTWTADAGVYQINPGAQEGPESPPDGSLAPSELRGASSATSP